jgi:hypothetical protein
MKLKSPVNEEFFKQNFKFFHAKIIHRHRHRCRQKIVEKTAKFCKLTLSIFITVILKKQFF